MLVHGDNLLGMSALRARSPDGFALAYLLYPATGWLTLNEFHPVALATPLLLFAFWYLDEDRLLPFTAFAIAAAACKEEIALVVAGLGIWYALMTGAESTLFAELFDADVRYTGMSLVFAPSSTV